MQTNVLPLVVGSIAIVAIVMILTGIPAAAFAPVAFVLVCPLMMFVMMRAMMGGGQDHR
jgi:hypothetical protein